MNVLHDLRHVTAVGRLVKDDVDLVERGSDSFAIAQIAFHEFDPLVNPSWPAAAVSLRFEIVEHANFPTFAHKQISDVRSNQASTAGNERAFPMAFAHPSVVEAVAATSKRLGFFAAEDSRHYNSGQMRARPSRSTISRKNARVAGAVSIVDLELSLRSSSQTRRNVARSSTS